MFDQLDRPEHGAVVTMGVFDGFHRGHQALVQRACEHGSRLRLPTILVTFDPHPMLVTCPERAPRQLLSVADRVAHARSLGIDRVAVLPFTREVAATSAEDFVAGLVRATRLRKLVVGANFRCGRAGAGDVDYLAAAGEWHGFGVEALDLLQVDGRACSSTEVRRLLAAGDEQGARTLLGRVEPRLLAMVG